jgi:hypothetical protein
MDPSEKFVKFAAECESMAKFTHTAENTEVWKRMAERWRRCAEVYDRQSSMSHQANTAKRNRTVPHSWAP